MSSEASAVSMRARLAACVLAAAVLACALIGTQVQPARADGGVHFVSASGPVDMESVNPAPNDFYKIALEFDKNVGYPFPGEDDSFVQENLSKVCLLDSDGHEVGSSWAKVGNSREERRIIYLQTADWLKPLTTYTAHVDAGVRAANGTDVSTEAYELKFRTSAQCSNGLTVYQNLLIAISVLAIAVGLAVTVARTRKELR